MFHKIHILQHQRGPLFHDGDFARLIGPGKHRIGRVFGKSRDAIERVDPLKTKFEHPLLDVLLQHEHVRDALHIVDLTDTQRALVWKDGRLAYIVGPGRHAFWKEPHRLMVETFDIESGVRFVHPKLATIVQHPDATRWLDGVQVEAGTEVLLYRDGVLIERLAEGLHVYWKHAGKIRWRAIDLREQVADVAGQEIITADKVSLRVNLLVTYVVSDALKAAASVADFTQTLYREAQLVLRAAIGTRTIDQLLADKESVGGEVRNALSARAGEIGVQVCSVGLRDIILPGEMRTLLNQVVAATKEAEANLIKRREETASVRSQANTAKLLVDNPHLLRLKELELLKDVLAGTQATFIFGEGDLARQMKSLVAGKVENAAT